MPKNAKKWHTLLCMSFFFCNFAAAFCETIKKQNNIINHFMQTIKLKRGLDIPFEGQAAETLGSVRRPEVFHVVPDQFAGITP
ncbi:MAG: hypothetical protein II551_02255, partial [Paludibacteraceae bacterium]|nr:hypothetical protein [Paludibacteraceae bacterium]